MKDRDWISNLEGLVDSNYDEIESKVMNLVKSNSKITKCIEQLKITDQELKDNLIEFLNIKESLDNSDIYPWVYNVSRKNGALVIKRSSAKNNYAKNITRKLNIILTEVNETNPDYKLTKFKIPTSKRKELITKINYVRGILEKRKPLASNNSMYIYGSNGTGKTYIANAMVNSFASRGISSAYIKLNDLFTYLKNKMSNSISLNEIKSSLKNVSLLVIDDLGFEKHNEWFKYDFVYEILQYRNANNKFTVLCSLLEPKELANYYRNIETDKSFAFKVESLIYELTENFTPYNISEYPLI
ncbi:ATP-binding protein [Mycoplasma bovis]|uniref:ATP-binding protein n=1 Tax=Mycoplasmopsis bovis TaxID=28903 RepID=UPI001BDF5CC3|nr:ATP-binding protein [Mycoplasmopsis bovis]MBT1328843.1 ATP-binding protein [Mycoplasmopsis bovis]MBT1345646.1 ATP-binding protein [Mycoplasmopsis bovis]MBT1355922.1 ATP-binding protein [Mycoplasmopsis bovis]MBT1371170.1 ATP-binding protein [Mycoplasmopsis bovis]MBT1376236.1 ATP-binding protein [Mycoplasmopsis bovis]